MNVEPEFASEARRQVGRASPCLRAGDTSGRTKNQNVFPAYINKCSTIGPRLNTGKNVNAPTMRITLTNKPANSGVVTGKVPSDGGTVFLRTRLPAIANVGMIMKNLPMSIFTPRVELYQSVFAFRPANADPLLPAADVNA